MYQNQYKPAILFLNDIIQTTQNPELRKQFERRLKILIIMDSLEKKVHEFKKKFGTFPGQLSDLVDKGLVEWDLLNLFLMIPMEENLFCLKTREYIPPAR